MQDYLAIVLRSKFTLFYRFGEMTVPLGEFFPFSGEIDEPKLKETVLEMLKKVTIMEYDSEALILHLRAERGEDHKPLKFELSNLKFIYPLTERAKSSISETIDSRIVLSQPIFETVWGAYGDWRLKKLHLKGADILCHLCKLESTADYYLNRIGLDALFEGLISRGESSKLESSNYWSHLIAYDRYGYFPKETIGCFYDAGEAYAHSTGKDTFVGSGLFRCLEELSPELRFNEILEQLLKSDLAQPYINKTSADGLRWYEIAPLFLHLKEDIRTVNGELHKSILMTHTEKLKRDFPDSFPYVVALLGLFWGYLYLYDAYYDELNLSFYAQKQNEPKRIVEASLEEVMPPPSVEFDQTLYNRIITSIRKKKKLSIKKIREQYLVEVESPDLYLERLEADERICREKQSYVYKIKIEAENTKHTSSLCEDRSVSLGLFSNVPD